MNNDFDDVLESREFSIFYGGMGFFVLASIILICLKLANLITFSWVWVLLPLIVLGAIDIVLGILLLFAIIIVKIQRKSKND